MARRLLVLGWHNIDPTPAFPGAPGAGRRGFDHQLRLLSRVANVITLSEAARRIQAGEPLPPRAVVLTFDDGYADMVDAAAPILARHRMPATFFLVPGFLDGRLGAWWEDFAHAVDTAGDEVLEWDGARYDLRLPGERERAKAELPLRLKQLDARAREEAVAGIAERISPDPTPRTSLFLGWPGAKALLEAGHEVGSHTVTHPILRRETAAVQADELATSRSALEAGLGTTVDTLAYPNGTSDDFDETTVRCVREVGYRAAVTVERGFADRRASPYEMSRVLLTPHDDLGKFARKALHRARSEVAARVPALKGPLRV